MLTVIPPAIRGAPAFLEALSFSAHFRPFPEVAQLNPSFGSTAPARRSCSAGFGTHRELLLGYAARTVEHDDGEFTARIRSFRKAGAGCPRFGREPSFSSGR